jgi:hypothetical protein
MSLEPLGLTSRTELTADALLMMLSNLNPGEPDSSALQRAHADARLRARRLYAVSAALAEPPGLIFRANP